MRDMNQDFGLKFDDCIDHMNSGQSVDECLQLYPEDAEELEPLLRSINELHDRSTFIPSEAAKAKGRQRLQQTLSELNQSRNMPKESLLQRLFGQRKVWAPATAIILLLLVGLGIFALIDTDGTTTPPTTVAHAGVLEIRVTDAPAYDISAVDMTISNIEVHRSQTGSPSATNDTGWETVIVESKSFELLELRGGIERVLGSRELPTGHYTQIRMDIEEVMVTVDGEKISAKLPSGKFKIVGSFYVEEEIETVLTLDFDAEESVVVTGDGKVIFRPTVKIIVITDRKEPPTTEVEPSGSEMMIKGLNREETFSC